MIARASATRVADMCVKASAATAPLTPQKRAARSANAIPFRVDLSMGEMVDMRYETSDVRYQAVSCLMSHVSRLRST